MLDGLLHLVSRRPLIEIARDVLDILIVAYLCYRVLLVIKGTRAMQIAIGIVIALSLYLGGRSLGLVTMNSVFQGVLANIVLIIVVVFQNDIRRGLMRVGQGAWVGGRRNQQTRVIDEVVAAATELARHRTGAIICFEQEANLLEFTKSEGIPLDASVTKELLVALFVPEPENKLHDGAVIIRDYRLARGGAFFPMPDAKNIDAKFGSRHRASMGITEETDAVVVVVSEERGTITVFSGGNMVPNVDDEQLRTVLLDLLGPKKPAKKKVAAPRKDTKPRSEKPERGPSEKPEPSKKREDEAPQAPPHHPRVLTPPSGLPRVELKPRGKLEGEPKLRPSVPIVAPERIDDDETEPPPSRLVPVKIEVGSKLEERPPAPPEPKVEVGAKLAAPDEVRPSKTPSDGDGDGKKEPSEPAPGSSRDTKPSSDRARPSLELPPLRTSVPMPEATLSAPPEELVAEEP